MADVTYDILLPTIPHRHEQMCALLAEIDRQWQPGLGMLVMRDNLERPGNASYAKWQELEEASQAEYTSFIGDDDWIAPNFVSRVMQALQDRPDYVGFPVRYTSNGKPLMYRTLNGAGQISVEHSLRYKGWINTPSKLLRDIVHQNPIRRELALLATWRTDHHTADNTWANDLRATGKVIQETWIPEPMYYYQETSSSWSRWSGPPEPMPESDVRPIPSYHWLEILEN